MDKNFRCIVQINSLTFTLTCIMLSGEKIGIFFEREYQHDGINNNFFKNPEKLLSLLEKSLIECEDFINRDIRLVEFLLPERFFRFKNNKKTIKIKNGTVNAFDLRDILSESFVEIEDCRKLKCQPIAYKVEDDYLDNPIGLSADNLELVSVSVGVLSRIKEFFDDMSKKFDLVCEIHPIADPVLWKLQKELNTNRSPRLVLYFDDNSLDVCYCEMESVIASKTIEIGKEHFLELLCEIADIDRFSSETLLKSINLNLIFNDNNSFYVAHKNGGLIKLNSKSINDNIKKLIDFIAQRVKEEIRTLIGEAVLPIYIWGNELVCVRGLDKMLEEYLLMPVTVLKTDFLTWNTSNDYPIVGFIEKFI